MGIGMKVQRRLSRNQPVEDVAAAASNSSFEFSILLGI